MVDSKAQILNDVALEDIDQIKEKTGMNDGENTKKRVKDSVELAAELETLRNAQGISKGQTLPAENVSNVIQVDAPPEVEFKKKRTVKKKKKKKAKKVEETALTQDENTAAELRQLEDLNEVLNMDQSDNKNTNVEPVVDADLVNELLGVIDEEEKKDENVKSLF